MVLAVSTEKPLAIIISSAHQYSVSRCPYVCSKYREFG